MLRGNCSYCGKRRLTRLVQDQVTVPDRDTETDIRMVIEKKTGKETVPGFPRLCVPCWNEVSQLVESDRKKGNYNPIT